MDDINETPENDSIESDEEATISPLALTGLILTGIGTGALLYFAKRKLERHLIAKMEKNLADLADTAQNDNPTK